MTNGEAVKRKAEESGDAKEEPIPVAPEKIAKLKETEESKAEEKPAEEQAEATA